MGRWLLLLVLATSGLARADVPPCPAPATVRILAENLSADDTVSLRVRGELLSADGNTCGAGGPASYDVTLTCAGHGTVSCGTLPAAIQPGVWVHHVDVQVTGSDPQHQSQTSVVLASTAGVSNVVVWTVFSRTFVVHQVGSDDFRNQLDQAAAFTAPDPNAHALVTFDPSTFPGSSSPTQVLVGFDRGPPRTCDTKTCPSDGFKAAYCLTGSRITVDALDDLGERGGVVLVNGTCERYLLRVYGSDDVLRGLELRGIEVLDPNNPSTAVVDTLAIVGSDSQRNRIEQCIVRGGLGGAPGRGDALSVGADAGSPGGTDHDAVIVDSEITGAQDKGIKVVGGGHATVQTSCVHDNMNGGIQATEGGHVTAIRNVVQLNRLGPAQNGLLVGVPDEIGDANTMTTDGNVVRFSGARGISVVNAGSGVFANDFVAENQQSGIRVETTIPGPTPTAMLHGVGLACNHKRVLGTCFPPGQVPVLCTQNSDCPGTSTCNYPSGGEPTGLGVSVGFGLSNGTDLCTGGPCANPLADLGTGGRDAGRNALAQNPNPTISGGVNLSNQLTSAPPIPARGNQWQDCGNGPTCNVAQVEAIDLRPPGTTAADIGMPTGPGGGPAPTITRIVPARPRAGDFVRVYNGSLAGTGGTFNGIDGVACTASPTSGDPNGAPVGLPSDPCSPESPETVTQNHTLNRGNRVAVTLGGQGFDADVHAVTPTMLIFQMPVDCFAAGTLTMTRGNDAPSAAVPFCDPGGCADSPAGLPCDDGNACTQDDHCDGNGACVPGSPLACSGPCQLCDPQVGCVPKGDGAACDDGNACTQGDHCSGTACVSDTSVSCAGPCLTGRCLPGTGCQPSPAPTSCDDGTACTVGDHCSGTDGTCIAGAALACDDGNPCTTDACDAAHGCTHAPLADGALCPAVDQCHGPALCEAGVCDPGPALQCSDGDFCTDDLCDPQQGCFYPQVTGIRRTTCRIDEMRALLRDVPTSVGMGRRLARRLDAVQAALSQAQTATRQAQQRRQLKKARGALKGFLGAIQRGRRVLGPNLERQLERSVKTAIATLTPS
jgi:hypothetical protein